MELNKNHRGALLTLLDTAKKEEERARDSKHNLSESEVTINYYQIEHFLSVERVKLITEALTENNIDY